MYATIAEPKRVVWIEAPDHFFAGALEQVESGRQGSKGNRPRRPEAGIGSQGSWGIRRG